MDRLSRIAAGVLIRHAMRVAGVRGKPQVRTAGKIEFVKDTGPIRRDIRVQDFQWTPEALRELAKILWASQRAQSYAMAAFRLFSKMPSAQISPDGLLGGRGYIQNIKDMRQSLAQAAEVLSSFTDTVDDEINAPHWQGAGESGPAEEILDQTEEVKQNPAGFVEEEFQEENPEETFDEPVENPNADEMNPQVESDETDNGDNDGWGDEGSSEDNDASGDGQMQLSSYADTAKRDKKILEKKKKSEEPGEQGSQLPGGTGEQHEGQSPVEMVMHTTTPEQGNYASAIAHLMRAYEMRTASTRVADSSVDPDSLPGPRIEHIGPGEGGFNGDEQYGSDDPTGEALDSGVNTEKQLPEGYDAMLDGTTGLGDPYTESAESVDLNSVATKVAALPQTYSWLPGADNSKNLDYYALGMNEEDLKWLREHSQPDPPPGLNPKKPKLEIPNLWETQF
jgi:hypothetical protein